MKRRKWGPKTKALVVLEGLKGKAVAERYSEHPISQSQYYALPRSVSRQCGKGL